ncbi:MAG: hypothetical protein ACRBK7_23505 [Acidimicrobiales bacterium]
MPANAPDADTRTDDEIAAIMDEMVGGDNGEGGIVGENSEVNPEPLPL